MESGLGVMDYRACSGTSTNITSNRPKTTGNEQRYEIGKYAAIHGSAAERKFHTKEKPLSESNAGDSLSCTKKKYQKHKRAIVMLIEIGVYYHLGDRYL